MDRIFDRRPGRAWRAGAAAAVLLGLSGCGQASSMHADAGDKQNLAVMSDVMKQVEQRYVVPVGNDKLVDNALKGMLSQLDPHSNYLTRPEYERLKSDMEG